MYALADCNNFFVSCERVFRPDLVGKPVIVLSNNDGCAVSRSNEAKALGIKMGDPLFKIRDIVERNGVAVFSSNFPLYGDMSRRVQEVLSRFSPAVEVYSIDEAFLDLRGLGTGDISGRERFPDTIATLGEREGPTKWEGSTKETVPEASTLPHSPVPGTDFAALARRISAECWKCTSIPVSVGIAPTKTLAKIASKLCKKYPKLEGGCFLHRPEDIEKVLRQFPVEDVWGIGRRSARKLGPMGIRTAWDFTCLSETQVLRMFHLPGLRTWKELRGVPCIAFEDVIEPKQSICVSRSFVHEISDLAGLREQVANFAYSAAEKLRRQKSYCQELAVFALTNRFREDAPQAFSSALVTLPEPSNDYRVLVSAALRACQRMWNGSDSAAARGLAYKKAGVLLGRIGQEANPSLFVQSDAPIGSEAAERNERLSGALDAISAAYGRGTVRFGSQGDGRVRASCEHQSPHYTTLWTDIPKVSVK